VGSWYYVLIARRGRSPWQPDRLRKSYISETTFHEDRVDPQAIEERIPRLADEVWEWSHRTTLRPHGEFKQVRRFQRSPHQNDGAHSLKHPRVPARVSAELTRGIFPIELRRCACRRWAFRVSRKTADTLAQLIIIDG